MLQPRFTLKVAITNTCLEYSLEYSQQSMELRGYQNNVRCSFSQHRLSFILPQVLRNYSTHPHSSHNLRLKQIPNKSKHAKAENARRHNLFYSHEQLKNNLLDLGIIEAEEWRVPRLPTAYLSLKPP